MASLFPAKILYVEGILVAEEQALTVEWPDVDSDVDTVAGGAQGVSPGADKCIISGTNVVPAVGKTVDLVKAKLERTPIEMKALLIGSPQAIKGKFIVREARWASGTAQPTLEEFRAQSIGPVPRPE